MQINPTNIKEPGAGVMAALLACSMLILMGGAAVTPGLPGMMSHFSDSADLVSFIITLPHLAVAIVGMLMGYIADRFGKFRVLVLSLLIFIITGAGSYFLDNIYLILVLRFLLGFGLAGIVCTVTSLIGCYYSGYKRLKMLGLQSGAMGVGVLLLEVIGGALADQSWNAPFLVYLIAVPFLVLVLLFIREPTVEFEKNVADDGSKTDMKTLVAVYLSIFIGMVIIFVVPTRMPSYMETCLGVSATTMGLFLGFHGLGNTFFSIMHRKFNQTFASMQLIIFSFLILFIGLILPLALGGSVVVGVATLIISGLAVGLIVPSVVSCVVNASTNANRGKMMGIYAIFLNLGQFAISLISIPVFSAVNGNYPDMFAVFAVCALIMAVVLVLLFGFSRKKSVY